ncbi:DUF58 domain-containing protein [Thermobifida halotolerans]|uniref:DUF58 domain-containing protein n=1 Tax=Thermobifida halotolerans TaxID=483545 RepID=A0AA97LY76_9ACTN|nr:DUF58 domain-containing protein [Thermobifida halotolerans]UOE20214.1 DUF58 domain-containing protein [Thermobifida halotolerans]
MNVLRSLTPRGRIFLGVGAVITVGALALGERDLLRIAVLVAAVPPVGVLLLLLTPRKVDHTRELSARRVPAGTDCRVALTLTNPSWSLPVGPLLAEDRLPFALGVPPRFNLGVLRPGERRTFSYRLRSHARGRYPIGPLVVGFVDPLGCARLERPIGTEASLLVLPPVMELPAAARTGAATGGPRPVRAPAGTDDDTTPRPYRSGDDLRRVHWRSTARRGRLMVRGEEQRRLDASVVLVDLRSTAHTGARTASSLEGAVTVAASIAVHLADRGHRLRLLGDGVVLDGTRRRDAVLDALALAASSEAPSLRAGITRLAGASVSGRGMAVAVVGALAADEVAALAACRPGRSDGRVAVLVPRAAWPEEARVRAARELTEAGWRVLCPEHTGQLPELWGGSGAAR